MNLKNKKVVITGATGGIGSWLVKKFADSGSLVLATGTKDEKLEGELRYRVISLQEFLTEFNFPFTAEEFWLACGDSRVKAAINNQGYQVRWTDETNN